MAGSISDYLELELLDHVFKVGAYVQPTIYIALSTADPLDDGSGIAEPVGNGYARKAHAAWITAANRVTYNDGVIEFAEASGAWGQITHFAIFDHLTAGNMLAHGDLPEDPDVVAGNNISIKDQNLAISLVAGALSNYLANALLDHIFENDAYAVPTNLYVALALATITDTMTGSSITEPAVGAYARVNENAWDNAAAGATANTGATTFVEATAAQGEVVDAAILDAVTGGNLLWHGTLDAALDIVTGTSANFPAGSLAITLT